jgi:hypothetical protein
MSESTTIKTEQQGFSLPQKHFIEHLMGDTGKPPREYRKNEENLSLLIRWLKNNTGSRSSNQMHNSYSRANTHEEQRLAHLKIDP